MKVWDDNKNAADAQIQNGCGSIIFDIEKNTPVASILAFFKDESLATTDTMTLRFVSRKGTTPLINELPVLPLMICSGTGPNHIKAYTNAAGLITRVVGEVQVGVGGSLFLGQDDSYLSCKTNFSDVKALKVYSLDGTKTELMYQYETIHLNAVTQRQVDLRNINKLVLSEQITSLQMIKSGVADADGKMSQAYSVDLEPEEIESIARGLNDIAGVIGKEIAYTAVVNGQNVPTKGGILAEQIISGGTYYNVIGCADYDTCKVQAKVDDRIITAKVVGLSNI